MVSSLPKRRKPATVVDACSGSPKRVGIVFFDREDNKIGVKELFAIALPLQTFIDKLDGKALFAWRDTFWWTFDIIH